MPITYCPHCAASNTYSLEKPKSCQKCGKGFASAFKVKVETVYDEEEEDFIPEPVRKISKARRVPKIINSDIINEQDDPDERESIKNAMIAKLQASGGIRVNKAAKNSIKIGDLVKNPDAIDELGNPLEAPKSLSDEQ